MSRITFARLAAVVVFAGFLTLAACTSDDDDTAQPPTSTPTEEPTSTPTPPEETPTNTPPPATQEPTPPSGVKAYPRGTRTGMGDIDAIIDAIERGDKAALNALLRYTPVECAEPTQGAGAPPTCPDGVAVGTPIDVIPASQCEGYYISPDEIDGLLSILSAENMLLFAVFETDEDGTPFFTDGEYGMMFVNLETGWANTLLVDDGSIVGVSFSCGLTPSEEIQRMATGTVFALPAAA